MEWPGLVCRSRRKDLVDQGWNRRFTADEPRLSEAVESYKMLGLEVLVVPGALGEEQECRSCFDVPGLEDKCKTIYTRGKAEGGSGAIDELFD